MQCVYYRGDIGLVVFTEVNLLIFYAVVCERTVALAVNAYYRMNCVIRRSRNAKHGVARSQKSEKRNSERVCAAGEIVADKRIFRSYNVGKNLIERFSAPVAVAVTG